MPQPPQTTSSTPDAPVAPLAGRTRSAIADETEARYRRADRLRVGDPVPPLALARLDGTGTVRLDGFAGDRPLVLLFGSVT